MTVTAASNWFSISVISTLRTFFPFNQFGVSSLERFLSGIFDFVGEFFPITLNSIKWKLHVIHSTTRKSTSQLDTLLCRLLKHKCLA